MSHLIPQDLAETLVDPAQYATDAIHSAYRWLRQNNPVGLATPAGYDPFWVITRYADILEVGRNNDLFHNGDRQTTLTDQASDRRIREITGGSPHLVRSLVQMDPPEHGPMRALTQRWFLPANIKKLEPEFRTIARSMVDRFLRSEGSCDFVEALALGYPLRIIMSILGVPEEDEPRMLRLTQELFGPQDPETARITASMDPAAYANSLNAVLADFYAYFEAITKDRKENPRGDLATVIANAQIGGRDLSGLDQLSYYVIVATAGHDTTSSSLAGAIWGLATNPSLLSAVQADPTLVPALIDEAIRWTTPVKHFMRSATADTVLAGRRIAKGDWLMLCYASGNRDEAVFDEPFEFRLDRGMNRQLAFGYGAHLCLGQHLAKMEMRILLEELIPRLRTLTLDGPVEFTQATFVSGPKKLPIRFTAA